MYEYIKYYGDVDWMCIKEFSNYGKQETNKKEELTVRLH